jgi:hypothetical protein
MVTGQADALHVRAMNEIPVHLDDIVLELTEADENWLTVNAIAWSAWWPDDEQITTPVTGPRVVSGCALGAPRLRG